MLVKEGKLSNFGGAALHGLEDIVAQISKIFMALLCRGQGTGNEPTFWRVQFRPAPVPKCSQRRRFANTTKLVISERWAQIFRSVRAPNPSKADPSPTPREKQAINVCFLSLATKKSITHGARYLQSLFNSRILGRLIKDGLTRALLSACVTFYVPLPLFTQWKSVSIFTTKPVPK